MEKPFSSLPMNSVHTAIILDYLHTHSLLASEKLIGNNRIAVQDDMWAKLATNISSHGPKKSGEQVKNVSTHLLLIMYVLIR